MRFKHTTPVRWPRTARVFPLSLGILIAAPACALHESPPASPDWENPGETQDAAPTFQWKAIGRDRDGYRRFIKEPLRPGIAVDQAIYFKDGEGGYTMDRREAVR